MRPITLTISAFGPYADETTLHFDELGMQRLFVITGPTGSGKTTVFEAILYALYGKLSKKGMDPSSLRCDFLKPDDSAVTFVDFVFEIGEKQYRIRRQPKQWVAKKRGDGKKEIGQEVLLECVGQQDFLPLTKISEVDAKVVDLIGLEEEQFKKIVMLPQGAFQEFLISNTKEKIELLRNIFNTGLYDTALQRLKGRVSKMTEDYGRVRTQYQAQCGMLKADAPIVFGEYPSAEEVAQLEKLMADEEAKIDALNNQVQTADADYKIAIDWLNRQQQHNADVLQWQEAVTRKNVLAQQRDVMQQQKHRIAEIEKAEKVLVKEQRFNEEQAQVTALQQGVQQAEALCEQLTEQAKVAEARHHQAKEERRAADEAFRMVPSLSNRLMRLQQIVQKKQSMEAMQQAYAVNQKKQETTAKALADISKKLEEAEGALKEKQRLQTEQVSKKLALSELNDVLVEERRLFKLASTIVKRADRLQEYLANEAAGKALLDEKETALLAARAQNRQHLAASLAEGLKDGLPCPVCGAIHHPNVAVDEGVNTAEDTLLEERDAAQREYMRVQAIVEQEKKTLKEEMTELAAVQDALSDVEAVRRYQTTLSEQGKKNKARSLELEQEIATIEKALSAHEDIETVLATVKDEQSQIQLAHTEAVTQAGQALGVLKKTEEEIQALESEADFDANEDVDALENKINDIKRKHQEAGEAFNQAQEAHARVLLEKASAESSLIEKKNHLLDTERIVTELQDAFAAMRDALFEDPQSYLDAKADIEKKLVLQQEVETYNNEWTQIVTTCDMLEERLKDMREVVDLSEAEARCQQLQVALKEANDALSEQKARCQSNAAIIATIQQLLEQFKGLEQEFAVMGQLRDVLDGKNQFNMRFETFAQAYYFESMLEHANQRLARMTHGRYSFRRKEAVRDGRKQAGLDLDVMDQYTGRARDVATLSGGESFKASLSLALGLADVVSSESGGVELSTIFIDEGFGTLDEESLDDTVETLLQLQESGRLVGVISHVAELKERIPAHLVVTSGNRGSHAQFEVRE